MTNPYRNDFPILNRTYNGKPLIYLDSAATSQKPEIVIQSIFDYYSTTNANPYRGQYALSVKATDQYEKARKLVADFIHAKRSEEIIFTRNTTEAINLLALSYGRENINRDDEILISISEHHSNIIPWQIVAKEKNAKLKYLYLNDVGQIDKEEIENKITDRTKIVSIAVVSNVLGTIHPVADIIKKAHSVGAIVILDCAQSIPHYQVDVCQLDADFIAFSGHKILGPMGIGVLYGKYTLLDNMPPFMTGGEMMKSVSEQESTFTSIPLKFEAGTPNVAGAVGLIKALEYIKQVGYETINQIESELTSYALDLLSEVPHIKIYGENKLSKTRGSVISFNIAEVHPHDCATILDEDGIAIRAGHQCAQPLMNYMKLEATCRISLYFYNTREDIDRFIRSLKKVRRLLNYGD